MLTSDAIALVSPAARAFLTAAMLANRALARQLGCSSAPAGRIADPGRRISGGNACTTRTHADGIKCTSCPSAPAVCAPAECHSRARADGVVCTTCIDARGESRTDCPEDPPAACHSTVAESGLLCTSCDGAAPECLPAECAVMNRCLRCVDPRGHVGIDCSADYEVFPVPRLVRLRHRCRRRSAVRSHGLAPAALPIEPSSEASRASCTSAIDASGLLCTTCVHRDRRRTRECMPAQCGVVDRCLRCVDPRGRVGVDCSIDYELVPAGSFTMSPNNTFSFASCTFLWGVPSVSGTMCHYPGTRSCSVRREGNAHCLSCTHPDGSGIEICSDRSEPLPDPMADRPTDLPAPGQCVIEHSADGQVSCAACTRRDLSASRACHHPGAVACELSGADDTGCLGQCTLDDGNTARLCNSARGPQLVL
jgi:hypothetical protein